MSDVVWMTVKFHEAKPYLPIQTASNSTVESAMEEFDFNGDNRE